MQFVDVTPGRWTAGSAWPPCSCTPPPPATDARIPGCARRGGPAARPAGRPGRGTGGRVVTDEAGQHERRGSDAGALPPAAPADPVLRGWMAGRGRRLRRPAGATATASRAAFLAISRSSRSSVSSPVWLSWWLTRYGSTATTCGSRPASSRRSRRVRLDRLQAVDVVRPLVARLLGLAELRLEVAGGSSEAPLAYLSADEPLALRAELLARAAGLDAATPEAPERVLHEVPPGRLLGSTVLSGTFVIGVVLLIALGGTLAFFGVEIAAGVLSSALPGVVADRICPLEPVRAQLRLRAGGVARRLPNSQGTARHQGADRSARAHSGRCAAADHLVAADGLGSGRCRRRRLRRLIRHG